MSGDRPKQFEIVAETRRVRTEDEKRAIVAEALQGHRNISAVARHHGIKPSLLFRWKKLFAVDPVLDPRPAPTSFVPVMTLPSPVLKRAAPVQSGSLQQSLPHQSLIEIEVSGGRKVRVGADIDTGVLKRIVAALETLS